MQFEREIRATRNEAGTHPKWNDANTATYQSVWPEDPDPNQVSPFIEGYLNEIKAARQPLTEVDVTMMTP